MTHDELLAKLDEITIKTNNTPLSLGIQTALLMQNKALRAVVELHKPSQETGGSCDENGEELWVCGACPDGDGLQNYPCPTIQAIEKELA